VLLLRSCTDRQSANTNRFETTSICDGFCLDIPKALDLIYEMRNSLNSPQSRYSQFILKKAPCEAI
jgi:hypothetical protein